MVLNDGWLKWDHPELKLLKQCYMLYHLNGGIVAAKTSEANLLPPKNSATFNTPAD